MKTFQGTSITGYVTIFVKGKNPELFFQACMDNAIPAWNVQKQTEEMCSGNVRLKHLHAIRHLKRGTGYRIRFGKKHGLPFVWKGLKRKKELLISLFISFLLILLLSNIIWKVEITGVPSDLEEKMRKQLESYGIHGGTWMLSLDQPAVIQQKLKKDIPELLWVGIEEKGTTYKLEGVEKIVVEEKEVEGPRHLVADKKGIIQSVYVSKGLPKIKVHDYVEKGDMLVSGIIQGNENSDEDNEEEPASEKVEAEGEIIAKTWYESTVSVPLKGSNDTLTGHDMNKYFFAVGNLHIPIWGFQDPDYEDIQRETVEKPLYFFKWKLPFHIKETTLREKETHTFKRSKREAREKGVEQAIKELQLNLGPDAEITSEKILHETLDDGKVKLTLYLTVEENIAKSEPITQGD